MVKKKVSKKSVSKGPSRKGVPTGVKVLSVLGYISAVATLLLAIIFFMGSAFVGDIIQKMQAEGVVLPAMFGAGLFVALGIFFLGCAILDFFLARGLWKGQNWARIFVLILFSLSALGNLISIIGGDFRNIVGLLITGFVIWYLGFNKEVKAAF